MKLDKHLSFHQCIHRQIFIEALNILQSARCTGRHERRQGQRLTLQNVQSILRERKNLTRGIIWKAY